MRLSLQLQSGNKCMTGSCQLAQQTQTYYMSDSILPQQSFIIYLYFMLFFFFFFMWVYLICPEQPHRVRAH